MWNETTLPAHLFVCLKHLLFNFHPFLFFTSGHLMYFQTSVIIGEMINLINPLSHNGGFLYFDDNGNY